MLLASYHSIGTVCMCVCVCVCVRSSCQSKNCQLINGVSLGKKRKEYLCVRACNGWISYIHFIYCMFIGLVPFINSEKLDECKHLLSQRHIQTHAYIHIYMHTYKNTHMNTHTKFSWPHLCLFPPFSWGHIIEIIMCHGYVWPAGCSRDVDGGWIKTRATVWTVCVVAPPELETEGQTWPAGALLRHLSPLPRR